MEANNQKIAHATDSEQSAKTALQTPFSATNQTDSTNISQPFIDHSLAMLIAEDVITTQECHHTRIIYNPDDSMRPTIAAKYVVVVQLELTHPLPDASVVVMITDDQPQTYFMGWVISADQETIFLSRDNPAWPQRRVNRSELVYLGRAVYMMYGKVE